MNVAPMPQLPDRIRDVEHLEELLSEPPAYVVDAMRRLQGDIVILGVGGKMGPSLARMAKRASEAAGLARRVFGVSRFSNSELPEQLKQWGIEPVACDLLDRAQLAKLPDTPNVVYMPGMKFGSSGQQAKTWAMNAYLPGLVCERYRSSKIVAFSTGNVNALVPVSSGGAVETDEPRPVGEYGMSCLGRERMLEHFSRELNIPMAIIRLNYAVEMRYGVLVDVARKVRAGETIDLSMGHFNCIWQGDANAHTLGAFDHLAVPPNALIVTGEQTLAVRDVADKLARLMGSGPPRFSGTESPDALLANPAKATALFGHPTVETTELLTWVADWVSRGGESLGKPTHFEARDGKF
jgi:nucleoside-diphosphate-sugar epimerase